jgi:hypothetical protein
MVANDAQASVREVAPYGLPAASQVDNEANQRPPGQSLIQVRVALTSLRNTSNIF